MRHDRSMTGEREAQFRNRPIERSRFAVARKCRRELWPKCGATDPPRWQRDAMVRGECGVEMSTIDASSPLLLVERQCCAPQGCLGTNLSYATGRRHHGCGDGRFSCRLRFGRSTSHRQRFPHHPLLSALGHRRTSIPVSFSRASCQEALASAGVSGSGVSAMQGLVGLSERRLNASCQRSRALPVASKPYSDVF